MIANLQYNMIPNTSLMFRKSRNHPKMDIYKHIKYASKLEWDEI